MRQALLLVLVCVCGFASAQNISAQNIKLITFRGDSAVVLRWIGNTDASITGWHVDRSVDAGPFTRLTTQPLTREFSEARATQRVGRYKASFYLMLFGADGERDLTQQDIVRTLSSDKVGFHFVLLAAHPELSSLTGELYADRSIPTGTRTVKYRVLAIANGAESMKAESSVLDLEARDRVPIPDSIVVEGPDNAVRLRWQRNAEESNRGDVVAFRVWKGAHETGPFEEVTSFASLSLFGKAEDEKWYTWTDEFIENGTTAYYYVRQVHGTGVLGERSEIVAATAGNTAPPPIPTSFTTSIFGQGIQLSWRWLTIHPAYEVQLVRLEASQPNTRIVKSLNASDTSYLDALVETGRAYTYVLVVSTTTDTVRSDSVSIFIGDVVAPLAPSRVVAMPDTGRIRLSWTRSPDADVVGYHVYRTSAERLNVHLQLTSKLITDTTFVDTLSRESETTHGYTITAEDRTGNSSKPSQMITARTIDVTPPVAPQITRFEQKGSDVAIAWTASVSKDVATYHVERLDSGNVERRDSANVWRIVHSTGNTNTAISTGGVGTHRFRIRAEDSSKNRSAPSIDRVLTIEAELTAPSNVVVKNDSLSLRLQWSAVQGADGYRISRIDPRTGKSTTCATLSKNVSSWHDRFSKRDEAWRYEIAARNASWKYGPSASVTFQPSEK